MLFSFRALASGSSGNAFLLQTPRTKLLFDAGIRLPSLRRALTGEGVDPVDLTAVIISHEHTDHCVAARELSEHHGVAICSNEQVLRAAGLHDLPAAAIVEVGRLHRFGDVQVVCFPVSHDAVCPVGFQIEVEGRMIALVTDLGEPTGEVVEAVQIADLVVLEANHDVQMLHAGRYPYHLRRRVAGPRGHLSNVQAASVLQQHVKGDDVDIWLAHLSKENNSHQLAARTVRQALDRAGLRAAGVSIAVRDRPSLRWSGVPRPRQLSLFADLETA